jgi:hypothetical protein
METLTGGGRKFHWGLGKCDLLCMWDFAEKSLISTNVLSDNLKSECCHRLNVKSSIHILELSELEWKLNSSGSTFRHSNGTTVPGRAMHSVAVSEMLQRPFFTIWAVQPLISTYHIVLILEKIVLLLCGQMADIRQRQTIVRRYKFSDDNLGSPPENAHS